MHPLLRRWSWALPALALAACAALPRPAPAPPSVVLVSIDGLRADVVGSGRMPALDALARRGVQAQWMNPSYPTLTFPNHYTLVTGLRPDHHGIVNNTMHDPLLGEFRHKGESSRDGRWYGGEPIWATLQRQGGIAATMFWPGSEARVAGQRPRHFRRFDPAITPAQRVDQVLAWFDLPLRQRPRLTVLYFEQVDVAAHRAGTLSAETLAAMRDVDAALARLTAGLEARHLRAATNLLVVSDHGMVDSPRDQVRYFEEEIAPQAFDVAWAPQVSGLSPRPGFERAVERAFLGRHAHYECWRKSQLPAQWHFGTHARIPPIVCQADPGWRLQSRGYPAQAQPLKGEHGYAPEAASMRAVFVADGPAFAAGVRIPAFDNVDVYPLLARVLHIVPAPNDGHAQAFDAALSPAGRR